MAYLFASRLSFSNLIYITDGAAVVKRNDSKQNEREEKITPLKRLSTQTILVLPVIDVHRRGTMTVR